MSDLTHIDARGEARMVDVSTKRETDRVATAEGRVTMSAAAFEAVIAGQAKKGDVLGTARLAGIMAAKRTADLIPLCHPLALSKVSVDIHTEKNGFRVEATAGNTGRTGVEMEALTAATVACLTIYDMAKALDREMVIGDVRLLAKSGGRSGDWRAA